MDFEHKKVTGKITHIQRDPWYIYNDWDVIMLVLVLFV